MSILERRQQAFFALHGFLRLRGFISKSLTVELSREVECALRQNYDLSVTQGRTPTGDDGAFLPMMGPLTPVSRRLASESSLPQIARELLGADVVPKPAKGNFYADATFWHADSSAPALRAIKMVTYFSKLDATNGALRVLPGSHDRASSDRLASFRKDWEWNTTSGAEDEEADWWPGFVVDTNPGDVILFDVHLWHAALNGRARTQWSVSYVAMPETGVQREAALEYIFSFRDVGHRYDQDSYPYLDPAWVGGYNGPFATELRRLGITQLGRRTYHSSATTESMSSSM